MGVSFGVRGFFYISPAGAVAQIFVPAVDGAGDFGGESVDERGIHE
jgi:hypothetical protein